MTFTEGGFAIKLRFPAAVVQPIPSGMGFDIAASIPLIYSMAYYSLFDAARLQAGETIGQWMASNGAVNILYLSRSGLQKAEAQETVKELTSSGVKATVFACDICDRGALEQV